MKKVQVACILSIVALFLGWLPKLGADQTFWYLDNDFAHYYLTGSLVRSGINPYAVNLAPLYAEQGFTPTRDIPQAGAPPALAVVMAPFSALSPAPAFFAWSAVQVGSLVFGVTRVQGLCLMLFIPYLLWERRERRDLVGSSMMMLVACCLLSPTSWPHYLPLVTGGFIYLLRAIQVSARPSVSLGVVLVAYLCTSVAMGYLPQGDLVMRLVSAWWGPLCLIAILGLMTAARRECGVFRR